MGYRCESLKLLAGFATLAFGLTGQTRAEPGNTRNKTALSKQKAGPTDLYGDPLPRGAIARLGTVRLHHPESFSPVLFSPDGNYLITASEFTARKLQQGRIVHLWNAKTGQHNQQLGPTDLLTHVGGITGIPGSGAEPGLAVSAKGSTLAAVNPTGVVDLWSLRTRKRIGQIETDADDTTVEGIALSPDGKFFACAGRTSLEIWDVATRKQIEAFEGDGKAVSCTFSPDGKTLGAACNEEGVRLFNIPTGKEVRRFRVKSISFACVAFSLDGKFVAAAGGSKEEGEVGDCGIRLWEIASAKLLRVFRGHQQTVRKVAFSPDGKCLASRSNSASARLWEVRSGKERRRLIGHRGAISGLTFSPDGKVLATASYDSTVKLWEVLTGKELFPRPTHQAELLCAAYSVDGRLLASADSDGVILVWDAASGKLVRSLRADKKAVTLLSLMPGTKGLACAHEDGGIRCWDVTTGKDVLPINRPEQKDAEVITCAGGKALLRYGSNGKVHLWDMPSCTEIPVPPPMRDRINVSLATFSSDGKVLAACGKKPPIYVYAVATGKQISRIVSNQVFGSLHLSADGKTLAGLSEREDKVYVWDTLTGNERALLPLHGRSLDPTKIDISPDGKLVATARHEAPIRIWEVASENEGLQFTSKEMKNVNALKFSPDGRTLTTGDGAYNTLLVWDLTGLLRKGSLSTIELSPLQLAACWADLAGADAYIAHRAGWKFVYCQKQAVPFLQKHLAPVRPANAKRAQRLIRNLDHSRFAVRHHATRELQQLGELAEASLRKALQEKPSLEKRHRVQRLIRRVESERRFPSGNGLRLIRVVAVLEHMGTTEARQLLQKLARGSPEAVLTEEAQASLQRLTRRPAGQR